VYLAAKTEQATLVVCPGDSEGCHSEERSDEESQGGRNDTRFFASTTFRLRRTTLQIHVDEVLGQVRVGGSEALIDALVEAVAGIVDEKAVAAARQYIAAVRE
jgi:hypothetical protein